MPHTKDCLILVDLQNDFCEGGALAVPGALAVVAVANNLIPHFALVIASRDWHPSGHSSFKPSGAWPPHCVNNTTGAGFHPDLKLPEDVLVVSKGSSLEQDAYSAFQNTGLEHSLRENQIETLYVMGLATDYCVLATVLAALDADFEVYLVEDGVAGVDLEEGDSERALEQMIRSGVKLLNSTELIARKVERGI